MINLNDGCQIAATAKMIRAKFSGAILVVEGPTDQRLLERFVDDEACTILCAHGKAHVIGAINVLSNDDNFKGALGFVDSDFDRIDNCLHDAVDIVVCDYADSEMMMFVSPALEKIIREYGSEEKVGKFLDHCASEGLREHVLSEAFKVAAIRYANKENNWGLCFKGLDFSRIVDVRKVNIDQNDAVQKIVALSKIKGLKPEIVAGALPGDIDAFLYSDFCSGHDCCHLVAIGLHKAFGTNNKSIACKDNVEKLLRLAYELDFFLETNVYKDIQNWEGRNDPFRILKHLHSDT